MNVLFVSRSLNVQALFEFGDLRSKYPPQPLVEAFCHFLGHAPKRFGVFGHDSLYERLYRIGEVNEILPAPPEYVLLRRLVVRVPEAPRYESFFRPKLQPLDGSAPPINVPLPADPRIIGAGVVCFGNSNILKVVAFEVFVTSTTQMQTQNKFFEYPIPVIFIIGKMEYATMLTETWWTIVNPSRRNDGTVGAGAPISGEGMRNRGTLGLSVETSDGRQFAATACHVVVPYRLPDDFVAPIEALDPHIAWPVVSPAEWDVLHTIHDELTTQDQPFDERLKSAIESLRHIGRTRFAQLAKIRTIGAWIWQSLNWRVESIWKLACVTRHSLLREWEK